MTHVTVFKCRGLAGGFLRGESLIVKTLHIQIGPTLCHWDWSGIKWLLCSERCWDREMGDICWSLGDKKSHRGDENETEDGVKFLDMLKKDLKTQ